MSYLNRTEDGFNFEGNEKEVIEVIKDLLVVLSQAYDFRICLDVLDYGDGVLSHLKRSVFKGFDGRHRRILGTFHRNPAKSKEYIFRLNGGEEEKKEIVGILEELLEDDLE